jgi:hypothetical protein
MAADSPAPERLAMRRRDLARPLADARGSEANRSRGALWDRKGAVLAGPLNAQLSGTPARALRKETANGRL